MIKGEYKTACRLKEQAKYNIDYDSCQILNLTCANYIYDLIQQSTKYEISLESIKKMLAMIYELLGHEIKYTIPQYTGELKYTPLIKIKGTFAQKPTQGIQTGFAYFCTDKQTTEGSRDGIMIYYAGDNTWVDALGRIVS